MSESKSCGAGAEPAIDLDDDTVSAVRMMMEFATDDGDSDEGDIEPEPPTGVVQAAATAEPPTVPAIETPEFDAEPVRVLSGAAALPELEAYDPVPPAARRKRFLAGLGKKLPKPSFRKPSLPKLRISGRKSAGKGTVDWLESDQSWDDLPDTTHQDTAAALEAMPMPEQAPISAVADTGAGISGEPKVKWQPTKKQIVAVLIIAVAIWKPWLIPGLLFLLFWVSLIVYFSLGPDRVTELVLGGWEFFEKRQPERAARWLARIQSGADRVDGWLARLPERWTDGIYLPDLGRSGVGGDALDDRPDPFDRLSSERHSDMAEPGRA